VDVDFFDRLADEGVSVGLAGRERHERVEALWRVEREGKAGVREGDAGADG
jgi:hypothetical protein